MKKLYTLLLCSASFLASVHAQFSLSPRTSATSGPNSAIRSASSTFTNNAFSGSDSLFEWKLVEMNIPSGWLIAYCDPKDCYASISSSSSYPFTIPKGQTGLFKCDFEFMGVSGSGVIRVVIKSITNPANTDTLSMVANSWVTGVNEVNKVKEVACFPNPVKDMLTVKFPVRDHVVIEIYNILGSRVKSFVHDSFTSTVNTSDLQNGVYFIRFKEGNNVYSRSFTKSE